MSHHLYVRPCALSTRLKIPKRPSEGDVSFSQKRQQNTINTWIHKRLLLKILLYFGHRPAARVVLPVVHTWEFPVILLVSYFTISPRRVMQLWLRGVLQPPHVICWHSGNVTGGVVDKGNETVWIFRSDFTAYGGGWDFFSVLVFGMISFRCWGHGR